MANQARHITHFARLALKVDEQECWTNFLVTDIGGEGIILGLPWLWKVNPKVDWEKGWLSVEPKVIQATKVEKVRELTVSTMETELEDKETPQLCCIWANRAT